MAITTILGPIISLVGKAIDRAIPDQSEAQRLKAEITQQLLALQAEELRAARDIIVAEAQGQSWLQRNWRPILMLVIVAIIANNYLIVPYLSIFWPDKVAVLALPDSLYTLMTIGVGGYIAGRSGEKIVQNLTITKK